MKQPFAFVPPSDPAVRSFALLLRFYPPLFRKQYGGEMILLFRDCLRDARGGGEQRVLHLWLSTMFDVLVSAPRAHLEEWIAMQASYTRASQVGALSALIASILMVVVFSIGDIFAAFGHTIASLMSLAMLLAMFGTAAGLYFRLNATAGSPLVTLGGLAAIAGVLMGVAGAAGWLVDTENSWSWATTMLGMGSFGLALGLLVIGSISQGTLGPWRFAPLLAFGMPVMVVILVFFYSVFTSGTAPQAVTMLAGFGMLAGMAGTGVLLWTQSK